MKGSFFTLVTLALLALYSNNVSAQNFGYMDKSPMDVTTFPKQNKETNKLLKVYYSRPFLKGRAVSSLAPNGKVWRTGANEAVEIRFYKDMLFGGENVKKGVYALYTIPGEKEWTFILSADNDTWGAYSYNKSNDVLRVQGKVTKNDTELENFSITFMSDMTLCLGWGTTLVKLPISIDN